MAVDNETIVREVWMKLAAGDAIAISPGPDEITREWKLNQCHANVAAWVAKNPGHRAVLGWLITGNICAVLHSVVDTGEAILDITPRQSPDMHKPLSFVRESRPLTVCPPMLQVIEDWPVACEARVSPK